MAKKKRAPKKRARPKRRARPKQRVTVRNPQDSTRRNVQAANRRLNALALRVAALVVRVRKLEAAAGATEDQPPQPRPSVPFDPRV